MYQVTAQILNLFSKPATEKFEATYKVQLLGDSLTQDGQVQKEMLTLNVPKAIFDSLRGQEGQDATFPIGFYVKNGSLVTFFPKSEADNIEIPGLKKAAA